MSRLFVLGFALIAIQFGCAEPTPAEDSWTNFDITHGVTQGTNFDGEDVTTFTTLPTGQDCAPGGPTERPSVNFMRPINDGLVCVDILTFSWNAIPCATAYRVEIATDNAFSQSSVIFAADVGLNQFTYSLDTGTYFWRLHTIDENKSPTGISEWTLPLTFDVQVPRSVNLLEPGDSTAVGSGPVMFSWDSDAGSNGYQLWLDTSPAFDSPNVRSTEWDAAPNASIDNLTTGDWHWRVDSRHSRCDDVTRQSQIRSFTYP